MNTFYKWNVIGQIRTALLDGINFGVTILAETGAMDRFVCGVLAFALLGCDAAGSGFRGVEPVTRHVDGSRFTLRFRGDLVEAIRTSPEMLPKFEAVARKAARAAEAERAGCETAWVEGDPAMMLLGLACYGGKAPRKPKRRNMLSCDFQTLTGGNLYPAGTVECSKL
ncbi:hypothetical protein [Thalassococcus lentus]|uniref:Lipoprotein n=1 Tax=Thalassococcus lentus TaxID=1210524 RepID=A0ABT4XT30_9RHOB|nr:hypothetical protein [Thalassococcus lentus]MDA7425114.1 hypothetical protein [Thalassococcus lentus]